MKALTLNEKGAIQVDGAVTGAKGSTGSSSQAEKVKINRSKRMNLFAFMICNLNSRLGKQIYSILISKRNINGTKNLNAMIQVSVI